MSSISSGQISAIHALKSRAGLDDESYRDVLAQVAGVASSKALTHSQAGAVIDRLKVLSGQPRGGVKAAPKAKGALELSGPYAGICRALWISAWHLGLVEHREDTALLTFVRRQTKVDHLNWVRDASQARAVIQALKSWMTRDAGVQWPKRGMDGGVERQVAVIAAQQRLLGEPVMPPPAGTEVEVMARLGHRLRARKAAGGAG